ncbi:unnamed protein product [Symbiodinium necroappetens]|uniref:Uncharacterized protein n=1 Tax=Symbiodinium necroappetens TaxID=1628268 RepID=A0A812TN40_9DINO|nr:unnamed protein product [Symbiodinium necroappetens]
MVTPSKCECRRSAVLCFSHTDAVFAVQQKHESLSHLVFDALENICPEQFREVCRSIQSFHEDLDKDGNDCLHAAFGMQGVLCRVPEYVDSIAQVSNSFMWARAVIEETAADVAAAASWEALVESCGRQFRMLSAIAEKPSSHWSSRNQDRALLNGLQPLPLLSASKLPSGEGDRLRPEPESLTSFGTSWSCKRGNPRQQPKSQGAAAELLDGAANPAAKVAFAGSTLQALGHLACKDGPVEDKLSRSVESARLAFTELWEEIPDVESAAASMKEVLQGDCSCWSRASSSFERLSNACSYAACETALLVVKCCSGTESWQKPTKNLEALSAAVAAFAAVQNVASEVSDSGFDPPPRAQLEGQWKHCPFVAGSFGQPCLASMLSCLLILIPIAVWSAQALPKSGAKKAKAAHQEDLHACRIALKDLLQGLVRAIDMQSETAASAAKKEASELLPQRKSALAASLTGKAAEEFEALRTETENAILDTQRKQLKGLGDILGQRSMLLKSRGAFKP